MFAVRRLLDNMAEIQGQQITVETVDGSGNGAQPRTGSSSIEGELLCRGRNDSFEVRIKGGEPFIFRLSKQRLRCAVDVRTETAFLAYFGPGRRSGGCRYRDGSLFGSGPVPGRERPAVLFRYAEGRPSQARTSLTDARANGLTSRSCQRLRRGQNGALQLDCDHLVHRPLTAILADEDLGDPVGAGLLICQSDRQVAQNGSEFPGHTATARTPTLQCQASGPHERCSSISMRAAPDIWLMICRIPLQLCPLRPKGSRIVGAFIEGYRAIPHDRVRILKLCIFSFHLCVLGCSGIRQAYPRMGVSRPCLSIGSPSSCISCCRGRTKSRCPDY
jgi:hypothetical protein